MRQLKSSFVILLCILIPALSQAQEESNFKIVFQSLAWSPDNHTIAFTCIKVKPDWSDYSPEKWGLFIYNTGTGNFEKIDSGSLYLSFSPDGKKTGI